MKDGNIKLRKWNYNSKEVRKTIAKEDSAVNNTAKMSEGDATYASENLGEREFVETTERKVLGLYGTVRRTVLSFNLTLLLGLQVV